MPAAAVDSGDPAGFGDLLRQLRCSLGVTQEDLARLAGISQRGLRDLEHGKVVRPRRSTIDGLARGLRLAPEARAELVAAARLPARRGASPPAGTSRSARSGQIAPAQLPIDVADFTGRDTELAQLTGLVSQGSGRPRSAKPVVAIVGIAGAGKTALAVHWAHQIADRSPDGQLYINLRGFATAPPVRPIEALAQLLRGLGVDPWQVPVELDEAGAMFRTLTLRRRMIIVLDNAASSQQVLPLLPQSPTCLAIVTSRNRLAGLAAPDGVHVLTLRALTSDDALALVERVVGAERVRAEPAESAELTRLCGGLPLALRIASAKLAGRPAQEIGRYIAELTELNRLSALEIDGDEEAAVRAAFDLSYRPLPQLARRLLRYLGLVPGPDVTPAAAAALLGATEAAASSLLGQLAAAHLIEEHGTARYRLHDLLRLYALQRAEAEDGDAERAAVIERLLAWYRVGTGRAAELIYPHILRLSADPSPDGAPFTTRDQASEWLDAERPNLLAAITYAAAHGPRPIAWQLADALRGFFSYRRQSIDWLASANAGLAAGIAEGNLRGQAGCELSLAHAYWSLGNYPRSAEHYEQVLDLSRQARWPEGEATALGNLGLVHWELGSLEKAAAHLGSALELDRKTGRLAGQANNLSNLGYVCRAMGLLSDAARHCEEALACYREIGSPGGAANALCNLGLVYYELGQPDQAADRLNRALVTYRKIGDQCNQADALNNLAKVHLRIGQPAPAEDLASAALSLARKIGDRRTEADALNSMAVVHDHLGQHRQAMEYHSSALRLAGATRTCYQQVEALAGLAVSSARLGRDADAGALADLALELAGKAGYRLLEGQVRAQISGVRQERERRAAAKAAGGG
jgi:tetratricopeptide (TPR) repeat protein/transcriptional regulator with XRE-family HTH domain